LIFRRSSRRLRKPSPAAPITVRIQDRSPHGHRLATVTGVPLGCTRLHLSDRFGIDRVLPSDLQCPISSRGPSRHRRHRDVPFGSSFGVDGSVTGCPRCVTRLHSPNMQARLRLIHAAALVTLADIHAGISRCTSRVSPVYLRDSLAAVTACILDASSAADPEAKAGGQDKEEPPRLCWTAYCKRIFGGRPFGQFTRRLPDIRVRPRLPEVPSCPRVTTIPAARRPGRGRAKSKKTGPACGRGWADARALRAVRPASLGWCSAAKIGRAHV
jgi:hypothetical protein